MGDNLEYCQGWTLQRNTFTQPHRVLNSNDGWKGLGTGEAMQKLFDKYP